MAKFPGEPEEAEVQRWLDASGKPEEETLEEYIIACLRSYEDVLRETDRHQIEEASKRSFHWMGRYERLFHPGGPPRYFTAKRQENIEWSEPWWDRKVGMGHDMIGTLRHKLLRRAEFKRSVAKRIIIIYREYYKSASGLNDLAFMVAMGWAMEVAPSLGMIRLGGGRGVAVGRTPGPAGRTHTGALRGTPRPRGAANLSRKESGTSSTGRGPLGKRTSGSGTSKWNSSTGRGGKRTSGSGTSKWNKPESGRSLLQKAQAPGARPSKAEAHAQSLVARIRASGEEVVVNIGGAGAPHEPANAINLNPNIVAPRKGIPNLVKAPGRRIGELFKPGTIDGIEGHNLAPTTMQWRSIAPGAYKVLRSGGRFEVYFRGAHPEAANVASALRAAGFRNVTVKGDVLIFATKP